MSLNAGEWNDTNTHFLDVAKKLFKLIEQYESESHFETIIDIGIGSGNITETLTRSLNHCKIYGLDVDSNMLEFARQNSKSNSIEYVFADLSGNWNLLDNRISDLAGQVPLILSNMVIDLIREKAVFAHNLKRLLKQSRRAYFTFPTFPNITRKLNAADRQFYENFVKMPDSEGQVQNWVNIFESIGFEIAHVEVESVALSLQSQNILAIMQFLPVILDTWTLGNCFSDISEDLQKKLIILTLDAFCNSDDNSVDWNILDKIKQDWLGKPIQCSWNIVYLVCKFK